MAIQRIAVLYDQRRYDLAEQEARRALAIDPDDGLLHAMLSLTLTNLDRLTEATEEAEKGVAGAPDHPLAHIALATALVGRNRFAGARLAAAEAIRLDPGDPDNYVSLANVELADRKWRAAYEATDRGLAIVADHPALLRLRSVAAVYLGRLSEATEASAASLASAPDESNAQTVHGIQLMHTGRFREAREAYRSALRANPENMAAMAGMKEAIKATNPLYRLMLRYFLWGSRLPTRWQLLLVTGGGIIFSNLSRFLRTQPSSEWLLVPLIAAWAMVLLSTWLAIPLSNLALFFHPMGRASLEDDERLEAWLIGGLLIVGVGALGLAAMRGATWLVLAVGVAVTAISTSAIFRAEAGWPRWILGAVALGVAVLGASAATLAQIRPEGISDSSPAWDPLIWSMLLAAISTWLAQWLTRVQPAR